MLGLQYISAVLIVYLVNQSISQHLASLEPDPCIDVSPIVINDVHGYRSPLKSSPASNCDRFLDIGWYRILSPHGDDMPISCPQRNVCGTNNPVWLNGSIPGITDGAVTREACMTFGQDCCAASLNIQIRNCTDFLLYKLLPTTFCSSAYCFGTTPIPTTTSPPRTTEQEATAMTTTPSFQDVHENPVFPFVMVIVVSAISILVSVTVVSVIIVIMFRRNRPFAARQIYVAPVQTRGRNYPAPNAQAMENANSKMFHLKTKIQNFMTPVEHYPQKY